MKDKVFMTKRHQEEKVQNTIQVMESYDDKNKIIFTENYTNKTSSQNLSPTNGNDRNSIFL